MLKYFSSKCTNSWKNISYILIIISVLLLLISSFILFKNFKHIKKELESCRSSRTN